jgi:benzoyl-CoA reductase/2-hydroxyglutaryl-CoA dehydratase subunit BcrC/BadD/HgdB
MNEQNSTVMSKVERYYKDYGIRARELKKEGKTVISYLCSLVPMEIITAAGLVPFTPKGILIWRPLHAPLYEVALIFQ